MPALDLGDWEKEPVWAACLVLSQMLHPDKQKWREELRAVWLAQWLAEDQERLHNNLDLMTPWLLQTLCSAPTAQAVLDRAVDVSVYGGIAGEIFLTMKRLHSSQEVASVNRTIYLLEEAYKNGLPPQNRQSMRDAWQTFKPVAHLWAAWCLGMPFEPPGGMAPWTKLASSDALAPFLARAEFFRHSVARMWLIPPTEALLSLSYRLKRCGRCQKDFRSPRWL